MANRDYGKAKSGSTSMSIGYKKPAKTHFADGGEIDSDPKSDEKVGLFERLSMGNIDEKGSAAYNRFGEGSRASANYGNEGRSSPKSEPVAAAPAASTSDGMDERDARDAARAASTTPKQTESAPAKAAAPRKYSSGTAGRSAAPAKKAFSGVGAGGQSAARAADAAAAMRKPSLAPAADGDSKKLVKTTGNGKNLLSGDIDPKTLLPKK